MSLSNQDLDTAYTALAHAVTRVGEEKAPLFLSMLCLSLISRQSDVGAVLGLIEQAESAHTAHG